jgi:hypothetical protein
VILDYVRLALATGLVLLPGALVARALGRTSVSATLVWSLACVFLALVGVFVLGTSLLPALVVLGAVAVAAVPFARKAEREGTPALVLVAGILFGLALWHVSGPLGGDALFHLARVRKLDSLGGLSLGSLNEFRDGGLHPGYAFPLWHGFLALVAKISGLDPATVVRHEASVLVPVAFAVAYESGRAVFKTTAGGMAVLLAQVALIALAPGHGGAYTALAAPPTAARQLLVPAVLTLFCLSLDEAPWTQRAGVAAGGLALALVHPTYALFVAVPLGGFVVARWLLARADLRAGIAALAALLVPTGLVLLWLRPVVDEAVSHDPSRAEKLRALRHYGEQLDVWSPDRYRLAPEVLGRGGAVAVAALVLVPVAALAARRRWAAFVLGGSTAVLVLMLVPILFTHFSDAVSLSQSRRAAGFLPFAFAFAGGLGVLRRVASLALLPAALVAGIVFQRLWPGDFAYGLHDGGPALATWIAAVGGAGALVLAALIRREGLRERVPVVAAALVVLPVAVHAASTWSPRSRTDAGQLSTGLVRALRSEVPKRAVVFSDLETSYRIAAAAPVYIAAAPPAHVADTTKNRPYQRRDDVIEFGRTHDLAIPQRYHAGWIILDRTRWQFDLALAPAYKDARYTLYRLS